MRILIDTNILISAALNSHGTPYKASGMCLQICIGTWRESNGGVPATLHVLRYTFACLSSDTNLSYV